MKMPSAMGLPLKAACRGREVDCEVFIAQFHHPIYLLNEQRKELTKSLKNALYYQDNCLYLHSSMN